MTSVVSIGTHTEPIEIQQVSTLNLSVPDPREGRYCKLCKDWLPVENFPSGKRRYICNLHRWERFGRLAKRRHFANSENKIVFGYWLKIYSDAKWFKSVWEATPTKPGSSTIAMRVNIYQKEIKLLLQCMVDSFDIKSSICHTYRDLADLGKRTAIIPISPTQIVSLKNAALVPSTLKRQLLRVFRQDGIEAYKTQLRIAETAENAVFIPSSDQLCAMRETLVSET